MKASRYVKPFAHDVDKWERMLSLILEVTEMLLLVQRLWMYMEVRVLAYIIDDLPECVQSCCKVFADDTKIHDLACNCTN